MEAVVDRGEEVSGKGENRLLEREREGGRERERERGEWVWVVGVGGKERGEWE